jgi:hypothetical protein
MKLEGRITPGKIFALLVLIGGLIVAVYFEDSNIAMTALGTSTGLYGFKKHEDRKMREHETSH